MICRGYYVEDIMSKTKRMEKIYEFNNDTISLNVERFGTAFGLFPYNQRWEEKKIVIKKIISGGQTGADRGGLEAGKHLGLQTGGTAPKGYKTENGSDPSLKNFGLVEHESSNYRYRTIKNVEDSDGTIWFGKTDSPGAILTINSARRLNRPLLVNPTLSLFKQWIDQKHIEVINVAGNRESKNPGIQEKVKNFLISVLK